MPIEPHQQRRVLIIDDEEIIRDSISTYLEDSGFIVIPGRGRPGRAQPVS